MNKKYCINCKKEIEGTGKTGLCRSCVKITHGKSLKQHCCIDCDIKIEWTSVRCRSCAQKNNKKDPTTCHFYKDGRTLIPHYCVDCGKLLIKYIAKRCKRCWEIWERGKNNPNYVHGGGYEPYTKVFNKILKNKIRNRDNHKCQRCGLNENKLTRKLDVHHIDYNKQNCKENNLISLCGRCNKKVNSNRDYWYAYFTYIVEKYIYA